MPMVCFAVNLDWSLSKNKKFVGRQSKILSAGYKKCRSDIIWLCSRALKAESIEFEKKEKVYIKIIVLKKSNIGDCINLIEGIADAIKVAIDVDDRYFSVTCDWGIQTKDDNKKYGERIFIEVKQ